MRIFISILIVSLCLSCAKTDFRKAQEENSIVKLDTILKEHTILNRNIGILFYKEKPVTATVIFHYDNGILAESIDYVNGRKSGWYRKWFPTGLLSFESPYADGKQHGITKSWWNTGNLRSQLSYMNGTLDGFQKKWYITGEKFKETQVVNGKIEGIQKAWRKNGKLYANFEVKNGRTFGLQRANLCYQLKDEKVQSTQK